MVNDFLKHIQQVSPAEFRALLQAPGEHQLVDVRPADAFAKGHLPGAVSIPFLDEDTFVNGVKHLSKRIPVMVYCQSGMTSGAASSYFAQHGFQVIDLAGGLNAWAAAGLPL